MKQDSRLKLKKPSVFKQKKIQIIQKKDIQWVNRQQQFSALSFLQYEDLLILRSFLPWSEKLPTVGASEDMSCSGAGAGGHYDTYDASVDCHIDRVFGDSAQDYASSMLAVPEISDEDLEPFLLSQELFVNFDLFS